MNARRRCRFCWTANGHHASWCRRPMAIALALVTLTSCYVSHRVVDADGGAQPPDAAPCDVVPVYAGRACVGAAPPCDFCPTVEAAYLARAAELECCLPFRCSWPTWTSTPSGVAQVQAATSCDDLLEVAGHLQPDP